MALLVPPHTPQMPLPLVPLPHQQLPQQRSAQPWQTSTFALYFPWKMEHPSQNNTSVNDHDEHSLHHTHLAAELSTKQVWASKMTVKDFYNIGKDLQNRNGQYMGADATKDHQFHAFFGCGAEVVFTELNLLGKYMLLPEEAAIVHLLWALFFTKVYPTKEPACATTGGCSGSIDPKTLHKYIWPIIKAWPVWSHSW